MSLVLRIEGPASSHTALQTVWTALLAVADPLDVAVPDTLASGMSVPEDPGSMLALLALLRTASAAVPRLVFTVSGPSVAVLPELPLVLREGSACRPRRGALPSPDAHRDQQLVAAVRAHWQDRSSALGLGDVLPRVSAPVTGLVLRAEAQGIEVHNSTGSPLQDLVVEVFGWEGGVIVDRTVSSARSLASGATARWPYSQLSGTQCTARAQATRMLARECGTVGVSPNEAGVVVVVPLPSDPNTACAVAVAVEDDKGTLLGVAALAAAPPAETVVVPVSLPQPARAVRARWSWTQNRPVCSPQVPVPVSDQPRALVLPRTASAPSSSLAPSLTPAPAPSVSAARSQPTPAPTSPPPEPLPVTAAGTDRYARAEREPWASVCALFPADSLDMDGRDRVREMLQSQRVASIVAGCNISRTTGWKTTVQTMRRLVTHPEPSVRMAAASGIGALAGPAMEHLLVRLVEQDAVPAVREAATAALAELRSR